MKPDQLLISTLLDTLDIGIFVLNSAGKYLYVNQAYLNMISKPREFFMNSSIPELKARGWLSGTVWEQVIDKKKPIYSVVTITDREKNRIFDALTSATPIFDETGEISMIFYTQQDVRQIQTQLQIGMMNHTSIVNMNANPVSQNNVDFIAESPQMKTLVSMLSTVAATSASILINGPTGSGKEVAAHFIHRSSKRRKKPLVVVNCAAIPENLIESELFGYVKGSFTGANREGKVGLIEASNGGTLFLDEINSMPLLFQAKLLRVLETKQVTRIGDVVARNIDFRLICASSENLQTLIEEKRFRSDLFYRINIISAYIPPLKERKEDIAPLALHFLNHYCDKYSRIHVLSPQALKDMTNYDWPGNVREIRNFIERLVVSSPKEECLIESIPDYMFTQNIKANPQKTITKTDDFSFNLTLDDNFSYRAYMDNCEKELLLQGLQQLHTPAAIANAFQLDLSNVYRKLHKHNISTHSESHS